MTDVSKVLPGGRVLLENARLSFLRGAKIGVLGVNGSGKSSLLRVIAGDDREHHGEVWRKDGVKFLYLTQEPQLDYDLDVRGALGVFVGGAMVVRGCGVDAGVGGWIFE